MVEEFRIDRDEDPSETIENFKIALEGVGIGMEITYGDDEAIVKLIRED